jgi:hypothetical protein
MYIIKSMIEEYKILEDKPNYSKSWEDKQIICYSSETETISTDEIIERFSLYLKI